MKHILLMGKVLYITSLVFTMVFLLMFIIHRDMQSFKEFAVTFIISVVLLLAVVTIEILEEIKK